MIAKEIDTSGKTITTIIVCVFAAGILSATMGWFMAKTVYQNTECAGVTSEP
jgi:C4-dicarboxylate-specific signal transduction histidine kinase